MKTQRQRLGARGERLAARLLVRKGYRILARNYVAPPGEADLVCGKGRLLVFVEVKARSNDAFSRPGYAVDAEKRRKYGLIAQHFVREFRLYDAFVRFDIVEVVGRELLHIEDAFQP